MKRCETHISIKTIVVTICDPLKSGSFLTLVELESETNKIQEFFEVKRASFTG